ncbi:MAG: TRAP transporter small permease [Pseudomonadota bacterium]
MLRAGLAAIDATARWSGRLAVLLFWVIGVIVVWEVAARYLFNAPTIWTEETARLVMVWGVYAAAALVLQERRLIAIDAVVRWLPPGLQRVQEIFVLLVILGFSTVAVIWGIGIVQESLAVGRASATMLRLPQWVFELPVPIGFTLLGLQALARVIRLSLGWEAPARSESAL